MTAVHLDDVDDADIEAHDAVYIYDDERIEREDELFDVVKELQQEFQYVNPWLVPQEARGLEPFREMELAAFNYADISSFDDAMWEVCRAKMYRAYFKSEDISQSRPSFQV